MDDTFADQPTEPTSVELEQHFEALREATTPEPPATLEQRVVDSLLHQGMLSRPIEQSSRTVVDSPWLRLAAAVFILIGTFTLGGWAGMAASGHYGQVAAKSVSTKSSQQFILLLYGDVAQATDSSVEQRVEEYADWARRLADRGIEISGEKLAPERHAVANHGDATSPPHSTEPLRGFFIVDVQDLDQALALAADCPHRRYGGRVEVRAVAD